MADTGENQISVAVDTRYLEDQSDPDEQRYVFAYTITIRNRGTVPAKLLGRHWVITDANGKVQEVRGEGRGRRTAAPDAGPGLPLHERRRARDAGRLDAGLLPDARRRRRAVRRADPGLHAGDTRQDPLGRRGPSTRSATCRAATRSSWRCSSASRFDPGTRPALAHRRPRQPRPGLARGAARGQVARRCRRPSCSATTTCTCSRWPSRRRACASARRSSRPCSTPRMPRNCWTGWLARPLLHRERGIPWTLIHAGLPPDWTLAEAERCAREVERALAKDAPGLLAEMYGDEPDRWSPALDGRGAPALHRQLPDAPALRGPQGPARAGAQGHDRGCAAAARCRGSGIRSARRGRTPSSSATGRRSATWPSPACSASTRVASGAARSRRSGSTSKQQPVRLPCRARRRAGGLISRRGPRRRPPTARRSGPRSAGRCGCPRAGAECS